MTPRFLLVQDDSRRPLPPVEDDGASPFGHEAYDVVIVLSPRGEAADRLKQLNLGNGESTLEPREMADLLARIESRMRRARSDEDATDTSRVRFGNVVVNLRDDEVRADGRRVVLATKELRLLRYLVERPGVTVSREELLREVWGYSATPLTRTVDVHVAWLRRKLEPNPRHPRFILTVHGLGYKFVGESTALPAQGATLMPSVRV